MNEQPKISAPTTPTQSTSYIKLEMWVKESKFDHVYHALNDIGGFGDKYTLRMINNGWDRTSKTIWIDSGILR
jgi:hypothetical protein